ncbi:uroporphyrinogen-III synthase [Aurantimonas sp. Leaf443]|uniref:uroporphyrinogen-III synthase n=1 Tax=Aurantimonas sp. Leaf443 TaxID=1736378 RepID=UPI0007017BFD|nr:uroporphyrinogen-III synthase [Aurantimonas sp. Leaf443]KQT85464.1 hypothetical protein ASG48_09555 [Aurantimonas sp. Leaf443]
MRLLILREAGPAAERTAQAVRAAGHEPVLLPLEAGVALARALPEGAFDAFALTSRRAAAPLASAYPGDARPVLCVGAATAEAARAAGFTHVLEGVGTAAAMPALLGAAGLPGGARILYAAGRPRTGTLEEALTAAGFGVVTWDVYETRAVRPAPALVEAATAGGAAEAALVLSRLQAGALSDLVAARPDLARPGFRCLCLSSRIAGALSRELAEGAAISDAPSLARLLELAR